MICMACMFGIVMYAKCGNYVSYVWYVRYVWYI